VESLVTQQIEEGRNTVDGIDELRSVSGAGSSKVIATFDLERDLETRAQDVRDRVSTVLNQLPEDARPPVIQKFDNDSAPVVTIALSADRSLRELTEIADKLVRVQLERTGGVGEVRVVGGLERAINVWIDADRLAAYQVPITAVRQALALQNADVPGGNVQAKREELVLRTLGRYADPRAIEDLVVANLPPGRAAS
jgi:HAE1 family hydrophobic/amphiphilic exporter-1